MQYEATARPGRQWRIFFMLYSPDAAHDGFDIVKSQEIGTRGDAQMGSLNAGRYFAVALYRGNGSHWICPGLLTRQSQPVARRSKQSLLRRGRPALPGQPESKTHRDQRRRERLGVEKRFVSWINNGGGDRIQEPMHGGLQTSPLTTWVRRPWRWL